MNGTRLQPGAVRLFRWHSVRPDYQDGDLDNQGTSFGRNAITLSGRRSKVRYLGGKLAHNGESCGDPLACHVVLPVDTFCIDLEQDVHTVSCPLGDLRCRHASV
jgi:hypothetical protein